MKKSVLILLSTAFLLGMSACKTAHQTVSSAVHDERVQTVERADSVVTRDSVFVFVREVGDTVRVIEREVKVQERVRLQHDTILVTRTDTFRVVTSPTIRSPAKPFSRLKTWLYGLLIAIVVIPIILTILKMRKL